MNYRLLAHKFLSLGYEPLAIAPHSKRPIDTQWNSMEITEASVKTKVNKINDETGIGVRCGTGELAVYAADFDFYDKETTQNVAKSFFDCFGQGPVRIGEMPKALVVYRGAPGHKKLESSWTAPDGIKHKFELLGYGQQFVAYGVHPVTSKPYKWVERELHSIATSELTDLDFDKVQKWIDEVLPTLVPANWVVGNKKETTAKKQELFERYNLPLENWSLEKVVDEILPYLDPDMKYDDWIKVGMALHHQGKGAIEWLEAWKDWSRPGITFDVSNIAPHWKSFSKERYSGANQVTLKTLLYWTKDDRDRVTASCANKVAKVEYYQKLIESAPDQYKLQDEICKTIAEDEKIQVLERTQLEKIVQAKLTCFLGVKPKISMVRDLLTPPSKEGDIVVNANGIPVLTIENVKNVLRKVGATVRYNTMSKEVEVLIPDTEFSQSNFAEASLAHIISACAEEGLYNTSTIKSYLVAIADENLYNPVISWIKSKPWDRVSRLQCFYDTLEVEDINKALRDTILRRWLIQAVAVVANSEGVMARGVLVLAGAQNKGKSRWVQSLAPEKAMVLEGHILVPSDKDSVKLAISAWITELGEIDATFKKSDISALKAFISKKVDRFRKPYAHTDAAYPRQTVFVGTVNDPQYLRDETGSTRYWTIAIKSVNHNHDIDMQQVWAEVYESMYLNGEKHWVDDNEMKAILNHNQAFTEPNPIEELILSKLDFDAPKNKWIEKSVSQLAEELGYNILQNQSEAKKILTRIGTVLTKFGAPQSHSANGLRVRSIPPLRNPSNGENGFLT